MKTADQTTLRNYREEECYSWSNGRCRHLDPCGNIGTEGRFDLVAIPWDAGEFADKVAKMIKFDLGQKMLAERHARTPPLDPGDLDALVRGVGLRIWIQLENPDQSIMNLLTEGYTVARRVLSLA